MANKVASEKTGTLTDQVDCEWCGAKVGEPCKIQGKFGDLEILHLCRFKKDRTYEK